MEVKRFWCIIWVVLMIMAGNSCVEKRSSTSKYLGDEDGVWVGAFYYPWFGPERHWGEGYRGTPLLGEYDSSDAGVIQQHIDWAQSYGVDFFVVSWWGQESMEDRTLKKNFRPLAQTNNFAYVILYESAGLLQMTPEGINLSDETRRNAFLADLRYLSANYFTDTNYLKISGRPVIFLYLTRTFSGDVDAVLEQARQIVREESGMDLFILADEVYWNPPLASRIKWYDGITAYNMHTSIPGIATNFTGKVMAQYSDWSAAAQLNGILFAPDIIPGFDDTAVRPQANHPVIPRSPQLFEDQFKKALEFAVDPDKMILITSWNEWHEDTSIEPSEEFGYQYLEVVRDQLRRYNWGK